MNKSGMKFSQILAISILFLMFSSCYKNVTIGEIEGVRLNLSSTKDFSLVLKMKIENPNFYKITVSKIDADISVNGYNLGNVISETEIIIAPKTEEIREIPLDVEIKNIFSGGAALLTTVGSGKLNIDIDGFIYAKALFKNFEIKIDENKEVKTF